MDAGSCIRIADRINAATPIQGIVAGVALDDVVEGVAVPVHIGGADGKDFGGTGI